MPHITVEEIRNSGTAAGADYCILSSHLYLKENCKEFKPLINALEDYNKESDTVNIFC